MRRAIATLAATAGLSLFPAVASAEVLYDQTTNSAPPVADSAQPNFSPSNYFSDSNYDRTADDFVVPFGEIWAIDEIDVAGALSSSPVDSEVNAYIYSDGSGIPGSPIFTQLGIAATNGPNYHVPLTGAPRLGPGTYWVTVQKVVNGGPFWSWGTEGVGKGTAAQWFSANGGIAACPALAWHPRQTCFPGPGQPDQTFLLSGTLTDTDGVETTITKRPQDKTTKHRAKYKFVGDEEGATFECLLRGKGLSKKVETYHPCTSPKRYKNLDPGRYRFKVRGIDAGGRYDFTPARDSFKVLE